MTVLRQIGVLAAIYLGVIVQTSLIPEELAGSGGPYLPAILLVMIAASCRATPAIVWSGLLGLVLDGLSADRPGIQLALAALLGLGLQLSRWMWQSRSLPALTVTTLLICTVWRVLTPMTVAVLNGRTVDPHAVGQQAIQGAAWTALLAGLLFLAGRGWSGGRLRAVPTRPAAHWGAATRASGV